MDENSKISVLIRKRPLNKKEINKSDHDIIEIPNPYKIIVRETKLKVDLTKYIEQHNFNFDMAFNENTTNE